MLPLLAHPVAWSVMHVWIHPDVGRKSVYAGAGRTRAPGGGGMPRPTDSCNSQMQQRIGGGACDDEDGAMSRAFSARGPGSFSCKCMAFTHPERLPLSANTCAHSPSNLLTATQVAGLTWRGQAGLPLPYLPDLKSSSNMAC